MKSWGKSFKHNTVKRDEAGNKLIFTQTWRACQLCGMWVPDDVSILRDHILSCQEVA